MTTRTDFVYTGQNIDMAFQAIRAGYGASSLPASPVRTEFLDGSLNQLDVDAERSGWSAVNISRAEGIEWALHQRTRRA